MVLQCQAEGISENTGISVFHVAWCSTNCISCIVKRCQHPSFERETETTISQRRHRSLVKWSGMLTQGLEGSSRSELQCLLRWWCSTFGWGLSMYSTGAFYRLFQCPHMQKGRCCPLVHFQRPCVRALIDSTCHRKLFKRCLGFALRFDVVFHWFLCMDENPTLLYRDQVGAT